MLRHAPLSVIIGSPENVFIALSAIGRLPGWIAQWMEMHDDKQMHDDKHKIARPHQVYVGPGQRGYVELEDR